MPAVTDRNQPIPSQGIASQEVASRRKGSRGREAANGSRERRGADQPRRSGGRLSRIWEGSLSGGLSVCVIAGSGVIGTVATIVTRAQPGSVLGLAVLAGTVAAALTVQPRTGRLIFPVPALSYLIGAVAAGAVYDRSTNKTELAVGAAQWIANGFFVMVLSTLLAIALTTVRWFMWRRETRRRTGTGQQWPPRAPGWDQRRGPRSGSGPYNFSSGA